MSIAIAYIKEGYTAQQKQLLSPQRKLPLPSAR